MAGHPDVAYCRSRGAAGCSKAGPVGNMSFRLGRFDLLWATVSSSGLASVKGIGLCTGVVKRGAGAGVWWECWDVISGGLSQRGSAGGAAGAAAGVGPLITGRSRSSKRCAFTLEIGLPMECCLPQRPLTQRPRAW